MPVSLKNIMHLSTRGHQFPPGEYPAIIVGVLRPATQDQYGRPRASFLLQLHNSTHTAVAYSRTPVFETSFNEHGSMYSILADFAEASNESELYDHLDGMGYLGEDTFDENSLIGTTVTAVLTQKTYAGGNPNGPQSRYTIVTKFKRIEDARIPTLDTNILIPANFANPSKFSIVCCKGLKVDWKKPGA